jgi:uncharacterized protein (DUF1684 family)
MTSGQCLAMALTLVAALPQAVGASEPATGPVAEHREHIADWRARRHDRLNSESGWLTLVGMDWLAEGDNRVGSDPGMDVVIPGGPGYWGTITLAGDQVGMTLAEGAGVTAGEATRGTVPLVADTVGEPTIVSSGTLSFYVIFRQSYALRVKDSQAPTRVNFQGIDTFDTDYAWRFDGRFIPASKGETIEIGNVLGQIIDEPILGRVEFEVDGRTYSVVGFGDEDSDSLYIVFSDKTAGRETYGGGRMLYSDGLPRDGRVVIDFNKAYNPPCAFTDYSTCILPPQENRLPFAIRAGEKKFH